MIYLFKTHYSISKAIIQINKPSKNDKKNHIPNLVDICLKNNITKCFVVDDSITGFIPTYKFLSDAGIDLVFGLRISFVNDGKYKNEDSNKSAHKNIIFTNTEVGYKSLIEISTKANVDYFFEFPRIDYDFFHQINNENLELTVPFYDSFLFNNLFTLETCIPDFRDVKPTFFIENHNLIYDNTLTKNVLKYAENTGCETENVCSVYYENKEDFLAWQTRKIMANRQGNRNTIENPNLTHCTSDNFCIN